MIIKECYIENFGTLHQKTFTFHSGLNVIKEDNGWGKSTLAAFIKAMFYGLEYKLRSKDLYDRTQYMPWQGGLYGGNLVFSIQGKEYKIVRYFGKKKVEDEFELFDLSTNLISYDYSEQIGDEIFGINCDSFERSIFITLDGKVPTMQDSIHAKIGNLIDNTDDVNNFEQAYHTLDTLATSIKAKRGAGGRLNQINETLSEVKDKIKDCENSNKEMQLVQSEIEKRKGEKKELEKKQGALQEEIKKISAHSKKREYSQLLKRREEKQAYSDRLLDIFAGELPTNEAIQMNTEIAVTLSSLEQQQKNNLITEQQRAEFAELIEFFDSMPPTDQQLEECGEHILLYGQQSQELEKHGLSSAELEEYEALTTQYEYYRPTAEELDTYIDNYNQVSILREEISNAKTLLAEHRSMQQQIPKNSVWKPILIIIGALLLLVGGVTYLLTTIITSAIVLCVIGLVLLLIGLLYRNPADKQTGEIDNRIHNLQADIQEKMQSRGDLEAGYMSFLERLYPSIEITNIPKVLSDIKMDINQLDILYQKQQVYQHMQIHYQEKMEQNRQVMETFLEPYRSKIEGQPECSNEKLLTQIRHKKSRYDILKKAIDDNKELQFKKEQCINQLEEFLSNFNISKDLTYTKQMEIIRDMFRDYQSAQKELITINQLKVEFEQQNDTSAFLVLSESAKTMEEIQEELENNNEQMKDIVTSITAYTNTLDRLSLLADKKTEYESEQERLMEEKVALTHKHMLLTKTGELLQAAKDNLSTGYMSDMIKAFHKYLSMLDNSEHKILLSADLETRMEGHGKEWKSNYYSSGYKDLVTICVRMALVDVMYKEETPFLILDDPFVNFDDNKIKQAMNFLQELAKETQVLYFVCHQSRVGKK